MVIIIGNFFYFLTVLHILLFFSYFISLYTYYLLLYFNIMSISLISPESNPDDPFISPNSNPEEVIVVKHSGSRPKNMVWNYFKHNALNPSYFNAKCKFYGTYWKNGIVKSLQVHLASKCENVDVKTKNKFMHYVTTRDGIINENQMEIESDGRNEELSED